MKRSFFLFLASASTLIGTYGCSGADAALDPTSFEALHAAPRLKFGTTCVEVSFSSYGTSSGTKKVDTCFDGLDCNDIRSQSDELALGDSTYRGFRYHEDTKYFEGTCKDQRPITCDQRKAATDCDACSYEKCCTVVALCEDDPNCRAMTTCIETCKDDKVCLERCKTNGEPTAVNHRRLLGYCMSDYCKARCGK